MIYDNRSYSWKEKGESLPQLFISREKIKRVSKTKYLGVIVDNTLGWEEQYESVNKKVVGGLVAMKKLKGILLQSTLYKELVESHLRYADVVSESLLNTKISALQRQQNHEFDVNEASKIKDLLIRPTFSIDQMFQFERSVLMLKVINKIHPESLHDKFDERFTISKYGTRNKNNLQIPRLNLVFSRKSSYYTGIKTRNSIPTHIRESNILTRFKNGNKDHFLRLRSHLYWMNSHQLQKC